MWQSGFWQRAVLSLLLPVLSFLLSGQGTHALALALTLTLTFTLETHLYYSHALAVESVI